MSCTVQKNVNCSINKTFGFIFDNTCGLVPNTKLWVKNCKGIFNCSNTIINVKKTNKKAYYTLTKNKTYIRPNISIISIKHVCLSLFMCSRHKTNVNNDLMKVYDDRIRHWEQKFIQHSVNTSVLIVDSCAQNGQYKSKFPVLSFNGSTSSWCSWSCPNIRENIALNFLNKNLPARCDFVFKVNAKYFLPDFEYHIAQIPYSSKVVVQFENMRSEVFGMERKIFQEYLKYNHRGNQEQRLLSFIQQKNVCPFVHHFNVIKLQNFTRRSDGRILDSIR